MKEKVYLDATIPSYLYDQRESLQPFTQRGGAGMIQSEILKEKERVQAMLSAESSSVHEYLLRARRSAEDRGLLRTCSPPC